MLGELIDAEEALKIGLINKIVPAEKLEQETLAYAKKLALKSPQALQMGKKSFYRMEDCEFADAVHLTNKDFAALCITEDAHEGVKAFFEKREAVWKQK